MGKSEYNIVVIIELFEHRYDAVIFVVASLGDQGIFIEKVAGLMLRKCWRWETVKTINK